MSDAPETDAVAFAGDFDGQGDDEVVFANLARRFERERNVLRGALIYIAGLDTSQDASPEQCSAVGLATIVLEDLTHT